MAGAGRDGKVQWLSQMDGCVVPPHPVPVNPIGKEPWFREGSAFSQMYVQGCAVVASILILLSSMRQSCANRRSRLMTTRRKALRVCCDARPHGPTFRLPHLVCNETWMWIEFTLAAGGSGCHDGLRGVRLLRLLGVS